MQERCEAVSIPEGAEGCLIAEVATMELSENKGIDVKQGKEEEEMQSYWKEMNHHPHPHHHHHPHSHPFHHRRHHHEHHKEKKWEKLEKKRMKMCGKKKMNKYGEGWNSKFKFVGKLKHKLEKIDWKIESLQEKKLFISRRIQEIEAEEEEEKKKKKNEGVQEPTGATPSADIPA